MEKPSPEKLDDLLKVTYSVAKVPACSPAADGEPSKTEFRPGPRYRLAHGTFLIPDPTFLKINSVLAFTGHTEVSPALLTFRARNAANWLIRAGPS